MKKIINRSLAMVIILILSVLSLAGCTQEELDYIEIMKKTAQWESCEFEGDFLVEYKNLGVDNNMANFIDGTSIQYDGKMINKQGDMQTYINFDITVLEVSFNFKMWMEINETDGTSKLILRMPKALAALTGFNKEYILYDFEKEYPAYYSDITKMPMPMNTQTLNAEYTDMLYHFIEQFNPKMRIVEVDETESIKTYSIHFDDKKLKELVKYLVTELISNDALRDTLKEITLAMLEVADTMDAIDLDDVEFFFEQMKDNKELIIESVESIYATWFPVGILGSDGIKQKITTDQNQNLKEENFSIHLNLNEDQIMKAAGMEFLSSGGIHDIKITSKCSYNNINNEKTAVTFPVTTSANSLDFFSYMLQDSLDYYKRVYDTPVVYNGSLLYFYDDPEIVEGRLMVPIQNFEYFFLFDWYLYLDEEANILQGYDEDYLMFEISLDSNEHTIGGKPYEISPAPYWKGDCLMVPIRFIADVIGCEVNWDAEYGIVFLSN